MSTKVVLNGVRLAFASIWEPKQFNGTGETACSAAFIIDPKTQPAEISKVVEAIKAVAAEKWGAKANDMLTMLKAKGDLCLQDGATKATYDGFAGNMFVSARNKARPVVVDKDKSPLTQSDGKPYSGCYVNVSIEIWAQDNGYGKRINAKLIAIQFAKDGQAFSGGEGYTDSDFGVVDDGDASTAASTDSFF
jgi:hypothetical protein